MGTSSSDEGVATVGNYMVAQRRCYDSLRFLGVRRTFGVNRMEGSSGLDNRDSSTDISSTSIQTPSRSFMSFGGEVKSSRTGTMLIYGSDSSRLNEFEYRSI